jgi:serine/threonine protein kinase
VALKSTTPTRREALESCLIEVEVLQQLLEAFPKDSEAARRVPRYIAHSVEAVHATPGSIGEQRVLVAMTKLGGQPLDQWLYGVDEHRLKKIAITELLDGPLPGSQLATRDLQEACEVVAGLLSQMAPVFRALNDIAFHRDVSAHNFLISMGDGPSFAGTSRRHWDQSPQWPQFAVLDFGLAVHTRSWQQEWQCRNIAGDPRYFSPAAWMLLAYGHKYLEAHPDANLKRQYKHRIDHFAFGVLALEVLFALWRGPEEPATSAETQGEAAELGPQDDEHATTKLRRQALQRARSAWRIYWAGVMGLFQKFHAEGAVVVRDMLARSQTISRLADELRLLCSALRAAAALQPTGSITASVLQIAAGLLDLRSLLSWQELPSMLPSHSSGKGMGRSTRASSVGVASRRQDDTDAPSPLSHHTNFTKSQSHIRKHRRSWTTMDNPRQQVSLEPELGSREAQQSLVAEEVATLHTAASNPTNGQAASAVAEAQPSSAAEQSKAFERRFSHRRMWTVDEAVSLRRGLPVLGMAPSDGHAGNGNKEDEGTPTAVEGIQKA